MNILIVTSGLYPSVDANSDIAYRIGSELKRNGCEISVLGYPQKIDDYDKSISDNTFGFTTVPMSMIEYWDLCSLNYSSLKKIAQFIKHPHFFYFLIGEKIDKLISWVFFYRYDIKHILKKKDFDCIICFSYPYSSLFALAGLNLKIPLISYRLDPKINEIFDREQQPPRWLLRMENKADAKSSAIIIHNAFMHNYEKYSNYNLINRKLFSLEFPNLRDVLEDREECNVAFSKNAIHCVFCGNLYSDIRNPFYTVKLFACLRKYNIILHFVGQKEDDSVFPYSLPENVICHGKVDSIMAMDYMKAADILVNIGNSLSYMLPSKILTYISIGKPILNLVKSFDCPTLPYMEKYPMSLNIIEGETVQSEDVERVRDFIISNKEKRIPFETIKQLYYECTQEYVGNKVYELICQIVEDEKSEEIK